MKQLLTILAITAAILCGNAQAGWVYTGCIAFDDGTIRTPNGKTGRIYDDGLVAFPGYSGSYRIHPNGRIYGADGTIYQMIPGGHIYAVYAPYYGAF